MTTETDIAKYFQNTKQLKRYVDILRSKGIEWGLVGPKEADRIWDRHILNSLALTDLIPEGSQIADVGSGAGLPGIPLAIVRPDITVTALEPLLRRVNFLTETVEELDLTSQFIVNRTRAEDCHDTFDAVVCRAVAPLDRLIRWCHPLLGNTGILYALKGSSAADEVVKAKPILGKFNLNAEVRTIRAHPGAETTKVVIIKH
ncbi:MAG: 16S rRNA (guanine(527)-N(7))-methyltransferase RsmG [Propionibacterium sp.]|nr:MAG: 16S rRNA (guanine(527)-N(7))-methyltransferase RsmG [Propionibacterium sp.]